MANQETAPNSLVKLLGDYNSDSENDEDNGMVAKVDEFFNEISIESKRITTNWTECIDKTSGHPYYWNVETKEVTWEQPDEYIRYLEENINNAKNALLNQWTCCYSDGNDQPYYVNEYTRKLSWEKPADYVEPQPIIEEAISKKSNPTEKKSAKKSKIARSQNGKNKNSQPAVQKKKYPFDDEPDVDEKIELISSFSAKTDTSSSEDESKSAKKEINKNKLNLVAEYNSNDEHSDDENNKSNRIDKPLFAAAITTNTKAILPVQISKNIVDHHHSDEDNVIQSSTNLVAPIKKVKNTFASIITGGRSPEANETTTTGPSANEEQLNDNIESSPTIELDKKAFKRKRRIEFITKPKTAASVSQVTVTEETSLDDDSEVCDINDSTKPSENDNNDTSDVATTSSKNNSLYANFKHSHTEFVTAITAASNNIECGSNDAPTSNTVLTAEIDNSNGSNKEQNYSKQRNDISELRTIIDSKLKFLCEGRPDVSAVQAIMIQMETLIEAYDEQALQPGYIIKWLEGISTDLTTLEKDAAPFGWKCLWNRKKCRYFYKNVATSEIQWDYPVTETDVEDGKGNGNDHHGEDEMDICTTPPPNVEEQLMEEPLAKKLRQKDNKGLTSSSNAAVLEWSESIQAPPPPRISNQPLPPGIDPSEYDVPPSKSEKINSELASFYSDLAAISTLPDDSSQTVTTPSLENVDGTNVATAQDNDMAAAGAAKKKKKKVKKLEPWRSGNLETWINKWQKAQKELDG